MITMLTAVEDTWI